MPWPLIVIPPDVACDDPWNLPVGAAWYDPRVAELMKDGIASKYVQQHAARRPPIMVMLPGFIRYCLDTRQCTAERGWFGDGWDVVGDLSNPAGVTVSPSINIRPSYHGWLQNGVISDDCEGRRFDTDGRRL
jgi:hypothetical protein